LIRDEDIEYIQAVWTAEFDLTERALAIAAEYGRSIERSNPVRIPEAHRDLIEAIAARYEVPSEVIESLLGLEDEFRNLHAWGARPSFRARVNEIVDKWLRQARIAADSQ
jgi:hypothetical protein